jgi:hypothetical protein
MGISLPHASLPKENIDTCDKLHGIIEATLRKKMKN